MTGDARFEGRPADWVSVEDARDRILAAASSRSDSSAATEDVPLEHALDRVLAAPLIAPATLPPWDNSAMDGYAVRAVDTTDAAEGTPVTLRVLGRVWAGDSNPSFVVQPGQATRIMTGAPLPDGADAVVRVEDTDREAADGRVEIRTSVEAGRYVRPAGEDFREGAEVLPAGRVVRPGVISLAAALGRTTLPLARRPSVALLATGDELRKADRYDDVARGRGIPESNTPMLAAMVRECGAVVGHTALARDDERELQAELDRAATDDVLVTIGGASMGEADLVKRVLDGAGFRQSFWRVRMRPGSPFSFGWLRRDGWNQPVFGLPGNPASAFVTFELFVRPFLRRLAGYPRWLRPVMPCVAAEELSGPEDLAAYLRVVLDRSVSPPLASLTGPQGSGLVRGLAHADGLAVLPVGTGSIAPGASVDVLLLDGNAGAPES